MAELLAKHFLEDLKNKISYFDDLILLVQSMGIRSCMLLGGSAGGQDQSRQGACRE